MLYRSPNIPRGSVTAGLPSWVPAANTVATIPENNTFGSIDPGTSAPNGWSYNLAGGSPFTGIWNRIIDDFSGGVYNPYLGTKGSMIYHGGGHAASNWNGIVAFDLATLTYSIILGGCTNCYPADNTNTEYADGQPMSPHSYDTLTILGPEAGYPKGALITPIRVAAAFESRESVAVHLFDFDHPENKWTRLHAHTSGYATNPGACAAYDPDLGRVWWANTTNESGYQQYFDLATQAQAKVTFIYAKSSKYPTADSQMMRYDSARKLLIICDAPSDSSVRRVQYFDTLSPSSGWTTATLSGSFPAPTGGLGFGFDKVPDGTYLCLSQARLFRLTVPAVLTDAWTVAEITYSGSTLTTAYVNGKRWSYVPALGGIVYKNSGSASHKIYKV